MNEYNEYENNINNDDDNETLLLKNPLSSNQANIRLSDKKIKNSRFFIDEYDKNCEIKFKIKELITLKISYIKIFIYFTLNIITLGFINIFINYFPSLNLYLLYDEIEIEKSSYIGIYCEDGYFYVLKLETFFLPNIDDSPLNKYIISNIPVKNRKIYIFEFKYFKYIYNENNNCFCAILFKINATEDEIVKNFWNGLTQDEINFQKVIYGKNEINIEDYSSSNIKFLFNCLKIPFNLFIIFSIILWAISNYIIYSVIILIFFLYFLKQNINRKKNYFQKLKRFESNKGDIFVEANRFFKDKKENGKEKDSEENIKIKKNIKDLVPGETYELTNEINIIPCDSILISGIAIVNESIITGESLPAYKTSLLSSNNIFNYEKNERNILYSGSKMIQSFSSTNLNGENNKYPKALVIGTSFMTQKGNIIRSIIFQEKENNKLDNNINKYIYGLFILSISIILISLCLLQKSNKSNYEILIIILNLMTIIVQPILPICLNIGIYNSIKRLKNQNIKCNNQKVMNTTGTIDTICLEPTQLLCEDNIEINGIQPVILLEDDKIIFDKVYNNLYENISRGYINFKNRINSNNNHIIQNFNEDYNQLIVECMACCNILFFDNNKKVIGNLIDLKMFETSKWKFKKYNGGLIELYLRPPQENDLQSKIDNDLNEKNEEHFKTHYEIGIIKYFEFSQKYQRMGVLVKNFNEKYYKYFVKGSPEIIKELCVVNSLPDNYDIILNYNIKEGNQIIALAYSYKNINIKNIDIIDREKLESDLRFLGFLIIKNKIKFDSKVLIEKLKNEKYNIIFSTYKNALTTINISRKCQIIKPENILFTIIIDENNNLKFTHLENYSDTEKFEMIEKFYEMESNMKNEILDESYFDEQFDESSYSDENKSKNAELNENYYLNIELKEKTNSLFPSINNHVMIIDGKTFEKTYLLRNKYISTKDNKYLIYFNAFNLIINKCRLFSSMNSFNKMRLIQSLKEKGDTPSMISNIINDYGSLEIANVGISFSDNNNIQNLIQDYIISEENDINSILYLLMEGKVSLINSIQIFKTIIICSFIQIISFIFLLYSRAFYTYKYFIISDILIIIPISFLISRTDTNKKLNEHKLTGGLINPTTLVSLLFQLIIIFFFQILSIFLLNTKEWSKLYSEKYNNSLIFYISNYQYLIIAISFSITYPFKKNIFTNILLIVYLLSGFSYFTYIFFTPDNFSLKLLNLIFFPSYIFRTTFIVVCFLNLISSYLCESYLVPFVIYYYFNGNNEKSQIL